MIYNPGINNSILSCSNSKRNIYIVRIDEDGDIVWENIYGLLSNPNAVTYLDDDEAWDLVEMPSGNLRVAANASDTNNETRATVLEIDQNGALQWIRAYGSTSNASMARAITRDGSDYYVTGGQWNTPVDSLLPDADIFLMKLDESSSPPSAVYFTSLNIESDRHAVGYDVEVDNWGDLLISSIVNCDNCFTSGARGEGTTRVYKASTSGQVIDSTGNDLGTVKAFDLWTRLTATNDGSALVSTKQLDDRAPGCVDPPGGIDVCEYSGTDAFVAKLDQDLDTTWTLTYAAKTTQTHHSDEDKEQECLYAIVPAVGGGYLISGNNSSNYDDDLAIKFEDVSSQSVSNTAVSHTHIYYFGPDDLTVSSFTVEDGSYAELEARNSITINGPFLADMGSEFEASVEDFIGVQARISAPLTEKYLEGGKNSDLRTASGVRLLENYPNPFNPSTSIRFELPQSMEVSVRIFDVLGREVATLIEGPRDGGFHEVSFDASNLSSGIYMYVLQAGGRTMDGTMLLMK